MPLRSRTPALDIDQAAAKARRIIDAANAEAGGLVADARRRAEEVYQLELNRSVERLAEMRDKYELLSSRLRELKEATDEVLTTAVRDHRAIRRVLTE